MLARYLRLFKNYPAHCLYLWDIKGDCILLNSYFHPNYQDYTDEAHKVEKISSVFTSLYMAFGRNSAL